MLCSFDLNFLFLNIKSHDMNFPKTLSSFSPINILNDPQILSPLKQFKAENHWLEVAKSYHSHFQRAQPIFCLLLVSFIFTCLLLGSSYPCEFKVAILIFPRHTIPTLTTNIFRSELSEASCLTHLLETDSTCHKSRFDWHQRYHSNETMTSWFLYISNFFDI